MDVKSDSYAEYNVDSNEKILPMLNTMLILMKKTLNLKLMIMLKFQSIKTLLLKICSTLVRRSLYYQQIKKKNKIPWTDVISDLDGKEIVGTSYEKQLQKTNQKEIRT